MQFGSMGSLEHSGSAGTDQQDEPVGETQLSIAPLVMSSTYEQPYPPLMVILPFVSQYQFWE